MEYLSRKVELVVLKGFNLTVARKRMLTATLVCSRRRGKKRRRGRERREVWKGEESWMIHWRLTSSSQRSDSVLLEQLDRCVWVLTS